tara:strand:+ start:46 stop:267 length:222 start_codon:yes stop_codon:yes gene_type:complete
MRVKTKGWSEERRQKQAENIHKTRPWEQASGPKSTEGKNISAQNAFKHGLCSETVRELKALLKLQKEFLSCHH